ncbi:hypothetical protein CPB86DRAFT_695095 [Serendipita vermifera]|nr:hypothetical protein CPB86DRAFT_695095 [Serendipita vermifera]
MFLASEVVNGNKYQCPTCGDRFNRLSRAESCHNSHSGSKPFVCGGQCGDENCDKSYRSVEILRRHCRPVNERSACCRFW